MRTDSQQKLKKLLTDEGYRTEILTDKIKTTDREDWVQKKLAAGMQVLIVNPSLVETGLDLNAFTTLVFYSMGYKLFTLRQASRRSWRINQKAPAVKAYMLYYEDTIKTIRSRRKKFFCQNKNEGTQYNAAFPFPSFEIAIEMFSQGWLLP